MSRRLPGRTIAEKLTLNSRRDGACLRWTGAHTPSGYGQMHANGKVRSVHRLAYELAVGELPDDLDIDHVTERGCKFRDCIEPAHLEAVTHEENLRRMRAAREPICPQGHLLAGANVKTYASRNGKPTRCCRRCAIAAQKRWKTNLKLTQESAQ